VSKAAARVLLGLGVVAGVVAAWRSRAVSGGVSYAAPVDWFGQSINYLASTSGLDFYGWKTPPAGQPFEKWFKEAGRQYGLPEGLLSRMAYQETGGTYRTDLRSPKGASGLMQLMPVHHKMVDPWNAQASIFYAGQLMAGLYRQFGGWAEALAAYNWGPGNLRKRIRDRGGEWLAGLHSETYRYVTEIGGDVGIVSTVHPEQGVA
jgi:soluble lytic murein transglycosylase-like protein